MQKWSIPSLGPVVQVAYAVDDLQEAVNSWSELSGIGPFFIKENIPLEKVRVDGVDSNFDHSSAYAQWGSLMVELICEHTEKLLLTATNTRELKTPSVHHCAVFVDNFWEASKSLEGMGFKEILFAETSSGFPFAMHDTRKIFGHFIEIYEPNEELANFYRMVGESAGTVAASDKNS